MGEGSISQDGGVGRGGWVGGKYMPRGGGRSRRILGLFMILFQVVWLPTRNIAIKIIIVIRKIV